MSGLFSMALRPITLTHFTTFYRGQKRMRVYLRYCIRIFPSASYSVYSSMNDEQRAAYYASLLI